MLFKVYIVGEAIKVVRRYSLPDVNKYELSKSAGVYHFPRVSCASASADEADLDPRVAGELILFEHIDFSYIYFRSCSPIQSLADFEELSFIFWFCHSQEYSFGLLSLLCPYLSCRAPSTTITREIG